MKTKIIQMCAHNLSVGDMNDIVEKLKELNLEPLWFVDEEKPDWDTSDFTDMIKYID